MKRAQMKRTFTEQTVCEQAFIHFTSTFIKEINNINETQCKPPLTAHIETGAGQNVAVCAVTHQVVSRLLLGALQAAKGDAQGIRGHQAVGADGHTHPVQRPVQRAGVEARLGSQRARGRQAGADEQDGILRGDHRCIWATHSRYTYTGHGSRSL